MKPVSVPRIGEADSRRFLRFAFSLADLARRLVAETPIGEADIAVKADGSYVSVADQRIEAAWREAIAGQFGDHDLVGEEYPAEGRGSAWEWVLDPIDGTDNFVHGMATFGTLVALRHEGVPVLGVIDHPRLDVRVSAACGLGASCNGRAVRVADRDEPGTPIVVVTAPENFSKGGRPELFGRLAAAHPNLRVYRDCYAHSVVLQGQGAVAVDWHAQLWDVCAAWAIAREAGAAFARLDGPPGRYRVVFGRPASVAAVTDLLGIAREEEG
jgi:fructose-1,6-bisphosphatase/inositol monophosphatase family enzyme